MRHVYPFPICAGWKACYVFYISGFLFHLILPGHEETFCMDVEGVFVYASSSAASAECLRFVWGVQDPLFFFAPF